jgi:hypothetical protein
MIFSTYDSMESSDDSLQSHDVTGQFISGRMRDTDVWRNASEVEFDNAMEGMEKLVMNRLYDLFVSRHHPHLVSLTLNDSIFTPQIVRAIPPRPITADDLERDRVLSQRIALFGWIEEKHLDIPEGEGSKGFLMFAQQGFPCFPLSCL